MTRALSQSLCGFTPLWLVENHQRFSGHAAVLAGAEREHINTGLHCDFRRVTTETGDSIAKTGTVHMRFHTYCMSGITQGAYFVYGIDSPAFGGLGQAER